MAYSKQTWNNGDSGTPLSAARLSHIEDGIHAAMEAAESAAGTPGPAGTITSASAVPLAAGASPTVTLGGTESARTMQFGIPAGAAGAPGTAATITGVSATSLAAGASPTVSMGGTSSARTFTFGIPAGAKGDKGDSGGTGILRVDYDTVAGAYPAAPIPEGTVFRVFVGPVRPDPDPESTVVDLYVGTP